MPGNYSKNGRASLQPSYNISGDCKPISRTKSVTIGVLASKIPLEKSMHPIGGLIRLDAVLEEGSDGAKYTKNAERACRRLPYSIAVLLMANRTPSKWLVATERRLSFPIALDT
jgi:hypothetical protein